MNDVKEKNNGAKVASKEGTTSQKEIESPRAQSQVSEEGSKKVTESSGSKRPDMPSREVVGEWCKRDLRAAIHLLSWIETHPNLLSQIVDGIYQEASEGFKLP